MRTLCFFTLALVSWSRAAVIPQSKDITRRDTSNLDKSLKLEKIKALLQELQHDEVGDTVARKQHATTTKPPPPMVEMKEPMREDAGFVHQPIKAGSLASDTISAKDLESLKELKRILERVRVHKDSQSVQPVQLSDGSSDEDMDDLGDMAVYKDEVSEISWRDLARRLQDQRDQLLIQRKQTDNTHMKVPTIIQEGSFVPFKDEIKSSVEKNLMTDLALAIHSGITIDEIIQDLTDRAHSTD